MESQKPCIINLEEDSKVKNKQRNKQLSMVTILEPQNFASS